MNNIIEALDDLGDALIDLPPSDIDAIIAALDTIARDSESDVMRQVVRHARFRTCR